MLKSKAVFRILWFAILGLSFSFGLSAQTAASRGRETANTVAAVKQASPGDYILLPSGKRYVLTKEEIAIVRGEFDYGDLSGVKTETREDGTEIKTITGAHAAYVYPDGQSAHLLKTGVSFASFLRYIEEKYHITRYIDTSENLHDFRAISSPRFHVFRAGIQFETISDGAEELQSLTITAYNYQGENFIMKYCSKPNMLWGNVSEQGAFWPTGESRKIEFDIE
ncbi:MAG: hypothetical protein LBD08_01640 [Treponema sp.]|jgi:hypothetical protein|nr:hypothetical protein [Treponema sp.]